MFEAGRKIEIGKICCQDVEFVHPISHNERFLKRTESKNEQSMSFSYWNPSIPFLATNERRPGCNYSFLMLVLPTGEPCFIHLAGEGGASREGEGEWDLQLALATAEFNRAQLERWRLAGSRCIGLWRAALEASTPSRPPVSWKTLVHTS